MSEEKPRKAPARLQVQIEDAQAGGIYSNFALINHSENEFVLDFAFAPPGAPVAKVRARVILSPRHMKRLVLACQQNLSRYEQRFGVVEVKPPAEGEPVVN